MFFMGFLFLGSFGGCFEGVLHAAPLGGPFRGSFKSSRSGSARTESMLIPLTLEATFTSTGREMDAMHPVNKRPAWERGVLALCASLELQTA